ncbi:unnamed protein product [Ectocarpus sp. 12 AP-2014]
MIPQLEDAARRLGGSTADGRATDGGGTGGYGGNGGDGGGSRPTGVGSGGGYAGDVLWHQRGIAAKSFCGSWCEVVGVMSASSTDSANESEDSCDGVAAVCGIGDGGSDRILCGEVLDCDDRGASTHPFDPGTVLPGVRDAGTVRAESVDDGHNDSGRCSDDGVGNAEKVGDRSSRSSSSSDEGLDVAWFGPLMRPFDPGKWRLLRSSRRGTALGVDIPFDRGNMLEWRRPGRMRLWPEQRGIWW